MVRRTSRSSRKSRHKLTRDRKTSLYGVYKYRGYRLVTGTTYRGAKVVGFSVLIQKKGFTDGTAEAKEMPKALAKAQRIVDAMHGD